MPHYDLIVIGSGPAGETGAVEAASLGRRVALIEARPRLGGAGVNTGTLPSKTLRESALYLSGLEQRGLYGVDYRVEGRITVEQFLYRKERVVQKQLELIEQTLERHAVDLLNGWGALAGPHEVKVVKAGGSTLVLTADYVLLATGSHPYRPENVPFDDTRVYDSDTILELKKIPASLTIVGAGAIGSEYACLFAALGVEVVLIDANALPVAYLDDEVVELLTRRMKRLGIEFLMQEPAETYEVVGDRVRTRLKSGQLVETEALLFASGRGGNTADLGLEALGIQVDRRGHVQVNEHFQTAVPHIYAAGDLIGFPALASTSMEQGRIAVCHAFQPEGCADLAPVLPYGLYTIPEVSMAGETEEGLREKGVPYEVGRASYANNARGQIVGDTEGMIKLLFSPEDRKLLGVHIIGEDATELVHIGQMALYFEGTLDCFVRQVFNYPTLSVAYKHAAYDGLRRLRRRAECPVPTGVETPAARDTQTSGT